MAEFDPYDPLYDPTQDPEFLAAMGVPLSSAVAIPSLPGSQATDAPRPMPPPPPPPKPVAPPRGFDPKDPSTWGAPGAGPRPATHKIGLDESPGLPGATDEWSLDEIGAAINQPEEIDFELGPENDFTQPQQQDPLPPEEQAFTPSETVQDDYEQPAAQPESTMFDDAIASASDPNAQVEKMGREADIFVRSGLATQDAVEGMAAARKRYLDATQKADDATARVEARVKGLSHAKIDNSRWFANKSTGQRIAAYLLAAVGGWFQAKNGGRNQGLDLIMQAIGDDVEEQKANLYARQQALGMQRTGIANSLEQEQEVLEATQAYHLATLDRTIGEMQTEMAKYDPKGATAQKFGELIQAAANERQRIQIETYKQNLDLATKEADLAGKQLDAQIKAKKLAGGSGGGKLTPEQLAQRFPGSPPAPGPMSLKEYDAHLATLGKGAEVQRKGYEARQAGDPSSSPTAINNRDTGQPYIQPNKEVWEVRDDKRRAKVDGVLTAGRNVRRIADLVKIMRNHSGGAADFLGTPEGQELRSLASQIDFETYAGYELGAPSAGDQALAAGIRGGADVTSFLKDPSTGFEAYAKGIEEKANVVAREAGWKGAPIKFPRTSAAQSTERTFEQNRDILNAPELDMIIPDDADPVAFAESRNAALSAAKEAVPGMVASANNPARIKEVSKIVRKRFANGDFTAEETNKFLNGMLKNWKKHAAGAKGMPGFPDLNDKQIMTMLDLAPVKEDE